MKNFKMNCRTSITFFLFLAFILLLSACAPNPGLGNLFEGKTYGFWYGLLHGFISLFTFIISLFKDDVGIYAANNTGGWYDFGFILGIMSFYGGGTKAAKKKKR